MNRYDADHEPDPNGWLGLDEETRIDLVVKYHRRHLQTPRVGLQAAQVYDVLKHEQPEKDKDPNEAYAAELRQLTAARWRDSGVV